MASIDNITNSIKRRFENNMSDHKQELAESGDLDSDMISYFDSLQVMTAADCGDYIIVIFNRLLDKDDDPDWLAEMCWPDEYSKADATSGLLYIEY